MFMTITLLSDVFTNALLTRVANALGRKWALVLGSLLMTFAGSIFATLAKYHDLVIAAVLGMLSPSGDQVGPFRRLETAMLAQLAQPEKVDLVAYWYDLFGAAGLACGSLGAGWMTASLREGAWRELSTYKLVFWIYAVIGVINGFLCLFLSQRSAAQRTQAPKIKVEHEGDGSADRFGEGEGQPFLASDSSSAGDAVRTPSRSPSPLHPSRIWKQRWLPRPIVTLPSSYDVLTVLRLCVIFSCNSLARGMTPSSLIAFFVASRLPVSRYVLGLVMATVPITSYCGTMLSAWLSERMGTNRALVLMHLPSAAFLALLPLSSSVMLVWMFLLLSTLFRHMEEAPSSALLASLLGSEQQTSSRMVRAARKLSYSVGPLITGHLADKKRFWLAFVIAGALLAGYDLSMLLCFPRHRWANNEDVGGAPPDEERLRQAGEFQLHDSEDESEADTVHEMEMVNLKPVASFADSGIDTDEGSI